MRAGALCREELGVPVRTAVVGDDLVRFDAGAHIVVPPGWARSVGMHLIQASFTTLELVMLWC